MLGVIGGSGMYKIAGAQEGRREETPYGWVTLWKGQSMIFLPRHGEKHSAPPHTVNYKANIHALHKAGATAIVGVNACGIISKYRAGDVVVPDDFIAFHLGPITYHDSFDRGIVHTDMGEPYNLKLNKAIMLAAKKAKVAVKGGGIIANAFGPRFETPAEIRAFAKLGANLISMTSAYESILAREIGVPYASIVIGTNYAAGMNKKPLTHDEVVEGMKASEKKVAAILKELSNMVL